MLYSLGHICAPVVGSGCESLLGSGCDHGNVVAYTGNAGCLTGSRCAGGIRMLADQHTSIGNQSICGLFLQIKAGPAVGILNFHGGIRAYGTHAQEEGCISADNLSIWISAHISDLAGILGHCAVLDHLVQFKACNHA